MTPRGATPRADRRRPGAREHSGGLARLLAVLLVAGCAVVGLSAPTAPATAQAAVAAAPAEPGEDTLGDGEVTVAVETLAPEVVRDDEDLTITGTITNGTTETLTEAELLVGIQRSTEITRDGLGTWLADERNTTLATAASLTLDTGVAAGQSVPFSVTVPAEDLPLTDTEEWGPRGVEVSVTDGSQTVATDRTIMLWDAGVTVSPTRVTTVIPVTASPEELTALLASSQDPEGASGAATATGSGTASGQASPSPTADQATDASAAGSDLAQRLLGLLDLAGQGVVLAVDPAILTALGVGTEDAAASTAPTADPGATPAPTPSADTASDPQDTTTALSAALTRAASAGDLIALPWADADLSALAHLGQGDLIASAVTRSQESAAAQAGADTSLAWTAGPLDTTTLNALPDSVTTVVADTEDMGVAEDLSYTPSGHTTLGSRTVLLPDGALSAALSGELAVSEETTALSSLDTIQLLRAQTAILTRQAPSLSRDVVLVLDRATAASLEPEEVAARVEAVTTSSWTQGGDLAALTGAAATAAEEGTEVERVELEETATSGEEMTAPELAQARSTATYLGSVGSMITDPESALGVDADIVALAASCSWRSDPPARLAALSAARGRGEALSAGLTPAPSRTVNLIASTASLPIRITSSLDQDSTVTVQLRPSSTRLQAPQTVTVTVPAHGEAIASVPVKAVGSGDVDVAIVLRSPQGTEVGVPASVHMRVRADWESIGTAVLGGGLVLLLVVGIVRTVRRGRRPVVTAPREAPW
ncbi:DUF6049 family protein [Actinomyces howellii]|uniref:Uncharacterized protein n=1 Tax=Actinomyces howellii TaxID=52771 RepID=A0A3S4R1F3_9ACTO|nr:DUF6049 family protein [Actinomyces howellii]VEG28794.1 Uncharacterised protein [Actinomyces howellii]